MNIKVKCEQCGKSFEFDAGMLPKINPIAARAAKDGMREVYVDCPFCGDESVVQVPIDNE